MNGERVGRHVLVDGDWIEVGHTFMRFREAVDAMTGADTDAMPAADLRTLIPALQSELEKIGQVADKIVPLLSQDLANPDPPSPRALRTRSHCVPLTVPRSAPYRPYALRALGIHWETRDLAIRMPGALSASATRRGRPIAVELRNEVPR